MIKSKGIIAVTVTTLAGLAVAYSFGLPLAAGFAAGFALLAALLLRGGLDWRETLAEAWRGALHTKEVVLILLFVSLLIPSWSASGTIEAMVGLGLEWVHPALFLTSAFLLSGAIAFLLGTSTGTLSAVGIPVIGMALKLGVPPAMAAGALVSGAFVGDRGSPFSSAFRLVADSVGIRPRRLARAMLPTTALGLLATLLFFLAADALGGWSGGDLPGGAAAAGAGAHPGAAAAADAANGLPRAAAPSGADARPSGSGWLYLPPILLVGTMLLRLGTRWAFTLAIASAVLIGSLLGGIPAASWPSILWHGWVDPATGRLAKGMLHMIDLVALIALAGAFNGLLERSGAIGPLVRKFFAAGESLAGSAARAGLFGLNLALVSCTQTLPIMMTGRHLRAVWAEKFGADRLGRVVADTSLLLPALVPWNMLAILCGTILGVPVLEYVPYAVYVWSIPLFTLLWSIPIRSRGPGG